MEKRCFLCPRGCGARRARNEIGFCGMTNELSIARAALHFWEEPIISGDKGSGTVFFSGCNLKCVFCQNKDISTGGFGKEITIERLREIYFELIEQGADINKSSPNVKYRTSFKIFVSFEIFLNFSLTLVFIKFLLMMKMGF